MVTTFDSLNRFETPMIALCSPNSKYQSGAITSQVGILTDVTDQEIIFNFNAPSELNFRVTLVDHSDDASAEERLHIIDMFRKLEARRLLYVQDIGYFIITSVKEDVTENVRYKDITAQTCEQEMANKGLPYVEDGTYQFRPLLETIISVTPKWTIGTIDENVAGRYRTFEDVSTEQNVLAFLMQDMQNAYECLFVFDIQNRIINVYDQGNYVRLTDIHITHEDFMERLDVSTSTDDLYTALTVFGDEDLNINAVNPLGTGTIYKFDHYIDWMSPALGEKVEEWQDLIESVYPMYYNKNLAYYGKLTEKATAEQELDKENIVLTMYRRARENIVAQASLDQVTSYNAIITQNGGEPIPTYQEISDTLDAIDGLIADEEDAIDDTEADIAVLDTELATLLADVNAIRAQVAISTYFTQEEYEELSDYIFEGEYTDEYVSVADSMDYAARFQQMKLLYDRAVVQLEKIAVPTQEFDVDVDNFVFCKDFQPWSAQLETGCLINVEVDDGDVAQLFLSTITINYEDKKLTMKFGNRYNKFDPESLFKDALGNLRKTANSVNYLRDAVYPIKNGELDYMQQEIDNSRTLTKDAVLSARNETVVIDDTGYTGRRIDPNTGEYDPKQIKITGRNIVFTDDAWETAKTALGEIVIPGSQNTTYGLNAETIIGNMIVGQELRIVNSQGEEAFVEADDAVSTVTVEYALSESTTVAPTTGWSAVAPAWEDGKYMWQRTTTEYASGRTSMSAPTCISGADGQDGQQGPEGPAGTGISDVHPEYYLSTSQALPTGGSWSDTQPAWESGKYMWVRSIITWDDGTQSTTTPVLDTSINQFGSELVRQSSEIIANEQGIRENFQRYSELDGEVQNIQAYVQTGDLGGGVYGVRIGKNDGTTDFSSMFTSDQVGFYDGDDKLAYLSNKKLNVQSGRFTAIEMTDNLANENSNKWRITCDTGYTIKYVG